MSDYIKYDKPLDIKEVAKLLYNSYEGPLKKEKIMSLTFNCGNCTFTVWDGKATLWSGTDLFDIKAGGSKIFSSMWDLTKVEADKFRIFPAQVDADETRRIVAQINDALAGNNS